MTQFLAPWRQRCLCSRDDECVMDGGLIVWPTAEMDGWAEVNNPAPCNDVYFSSIDPIRTPTHTGAFSPPPV